MPLQSSLLVYNFLLLYNYHYRQLSALVAFGESKLRVAPAVLAEDNPNLLGRIFRNCFYQSAGMLVIGWLQGGQA